MNVSWLVQNWGLKIVSLIIAMVVWFYASGEGTEQITLRVPLDINVKNENMILTKGVTQSLRVVFQGPKSDINLLSSQDIRANHQVDYGVESGEYSFQVGRENFQLPSSNVRIQEIYPRTFRVTLDQRVTKKLKVIPNIQGEPATGFSYIESEILIDPNVVLVQGAQSRLEELEVIQTEPIDIVGRIRSFKKKIKIDFKSHSVKPVNHESVEVLVPLVEQFSSKTYENIVVRVLGIPEKTFSIYLDPSKINIELKGPLRALEDLKEEDFISYVDVSGLKKGKYELELKLNLPEEISLKGESPIIRVIMEEVKR